MSPKARNVVTCKALGTILTTTALVLSWQNCSQVAFENGGGGLVTKVGGTSFDFGQPQSLDDVLNNEVPIDIDDAPQISDGESEEAPKRPVDGEPEGLYACGLKVKRVMVNVQFFAASSHRNIPLVGVVAGEVDLMTLSESGVLVEVPAKVNSTQIRMVFNSDGHYLVATDNSIMPLTISSQDVSGEKLKLNGQSQLQAGQKYLLKLDQLPKLISQRQGQRCRLSPVASATISPASF